MTAQTASVESEKETEIIAKWCVVKLEETQNWSPDIVARAKRIFGVYLFDANRHVHCCEMTPSYECMFVESQWDNPELSDREADWLSSEIIEQDAFSEPVRYFHCWQVDGLPRITEGEIGVGVIDLGIQNEEESFEYVRQRSV